MSRWVWVAGGVLVLVVAFVVTAFVTPGFLVQAKPEPEPESVRVESVATAFANAVLDQDPAQTGPIACADAKPAVYAAAKSLAEQDASIIVGGGSVAGPELIRVAMNGSIGRNPYAGALLVTREPSGTYCVSAVETT